MTDISDASRGVLLSRQIDRQVFVPVGNSILLALISNRAMLLPYARGL